MHVVVFSQSVFHVENLLYPPDISLSDVLCVVLCWPPVGPQDEHIKVKVESFQNRSR